MQVRLDPTIARTLPAGAVRFGGDPRPVDPRVQQPDPERGVATPARSDLPPVGVAQGRERPSPRFAVSDHEAERRPAGTGRRP